MFLTWYVNIIIVLFIFDGDIDDKLCPQLNQNSDKDEDTDGRQEEEDLATNNADYNDTKRRKRKKKHKRLENERIKSQEHNAECNENVDEIERSVREVNKLLGEPLPGCSNQVLEAQWVNKISKENILTVQRKHLNPYNELKKIFGSKTIEAGQRYKCIQGWECYKNNALPLPLFFVKNNSLSLFITNFKSNVLS